ncbi:MAG: rod shape-determining protein MreC [Steroidobacteraceae bacterium]
MVELSHDSRPIIGRGPPLGAAFITLAAVSIGLMVADVRYDQLGRIRGWLDSAAHPLQVAIDLPFRAWDWLTGSFADRDRLRRENLELTTRLRFADLQLQRFEALEAENARLREMRSSSAAVAKRVMVASIMNVDLDPFRHRVLLDRGAADGVFKGQAVLDAHGIFGQVVRVNARTAEVILISDAEHAIPVQSNRSGVRTIAVGTGDPDRLSLPFVTVDSDIRKDDLLISTGMGGVFPPGYPVARVKQVERSAKATFAIVEAAPTASLDRDREVLLVWFDAPAPGTPVPHVDESPPGTRPSGAPPGNVPAAVAAGNAPAAAAGTATGTAGAATGGATSAAPASTPGPAVPPPGSHAAAPVAAPPAAGAAAATPATGPEPAPTESRPDASPGTAPTSTPAQAPDATTTPPGGRR